MADRAARERAVKQATNHVRSGSVWLQRAAATGSYVAKKTNQEPTAASKPKKS
jgi:hypothetical protein